MTVATPLQLRFAAALRTTPRHQEAASHLAFCRTAVVNARARALQFPNDQFWVNGAAFAEACLKRAEASLERADFWAESDVFWAEQDAADHVALPRDC